MPCFKLSYTHSAMPKAGTLSAVKYAHTAKDAAAFLGKYQQKDRQILDKRGCILSNVEIELIP